MCMHFSQLHIRKRWSKINEQNKSIATGLFYVYIAICVRYQRSLTVRRGPKGQKKKCRRAIYDVLLTIRQ